MVTTKDHTHLKKNGKSLLYQLHRAQLPTRQRLEFPLNSFPQYIVCTKESTKSSESHLHLPPIPRIHLHAGQASIIQKRFVRD